VVIGKGPYRHGAEIGNHDVAPFVHPRVCVAVHLK
jgi:hypothetical protein